MPYSSIGRRIGASFLDTLILVIPVAIMNHVIPVIGGLLVIWLYAPVFESSAVRCTIGKHLMGIQVTDLSGGRISFRTALIRLFMKFVSSIVLFLGHLLALFTARKQTLHDLVAETVVIYGRSELSLFDAWLDQLKSVFGSMRTSDPASVGELERLQTLREKGALTEEEFQKAKARILGR